MASPRRRLSGAGLLSTSTFELGCTLYRQMLHSYNTLFYSTVRLEGYSVDIATRSTRQHTLCARTHSRVIAAAPTNVVALDTAAFPRTFTLDPLPYFARPLLPLPLPLHPAASAPDRTKAIRVPPARDHHAGTRINW